MNVLFLGPRDSSVLAALRLDALRRADKVRMTSKPIASHDVWNGKFRGVDWLISHRYTHRVPDGVLSKFSDRNLNIHLAGLLQCTLRLHVRLHHPPNDVPVRRRAST